MCGTIDVVDMGEGPLSLVLQVDEAKAMEEVSDEKIRKDRVRNDGTRRC
jgi:hypothetical protein